ncbi:MAG: ABC transporter permease [Planctomycetota bacterium]|nr:ABC transporter permease [Planctomycetota bacterium]
MNLFTIAWRSIQQRGLASALTSLSMALGVMLVVAVLAVHGVVSDSFQNSTSLGYNLIVGAKGGKLQLTLNTVYYLSQPVENIPYSYYLEFLSAERRRQEEADPGDVDLRREGQFAEFTAFAIPVCLGDYYGEFRSVGTTPDFFEKLVYGRNADQKFVFASGRNFQHNNQESGYWEAVVGSVAARELKLNVGDRVSPTHGDPELGAHHAEGFTVVGILKPSGTPNDRAVFVNIEGFYLMSNHAKPVSEDAHAGQAPAAPADSHAESSEPAGEHAAHADDTHGHAAHSPDAKPLPMSQREVTAILVRTKSSDPAVPAEAVTPGLRWSINKGQVAQAVAPIQEIYALFATFVDPIQSVLLLLTAMICAVSGISILVSIYNSMSERRHEIAVIRALGAGRGTVMVIVLLESVLLCLGGGCVGWVLAHTLTWLAAPTIAARTGVSIGFLSMETSEVLLLPALLLLAILCGFFPAVSAYRTDVAKSLGA